MGSQAYYSRSTPNNRILLQIIALQTLSLHEKNLEKRAKDPRQLSSEMLCQLIEQ